MIFRSLPTGGNPIALSAILAALRKLDGKQDFLSRLFPEKLFYPVSSGSAGLRLALESMKSTSSRREVVLPGYSCPSVLAAIINAGLKPVLCDLSPASFQLNLYDLQQKLGSQTLAVIVVHLFGLPDRVEAIKEIAASQNILVLEDAAQALGSSIDPNGHLKTGEVGDLSVFSFGQGKPFSLLSGGAVLVNNTHLVEASSRIYEALPESSGRLTFAFSTAKLMAYSFLFHPHLFWIPQSLPFLHIGETIFTLDLSYKKMQPLTMRLGEIMLNQVETFRACRQRLAQLYANHLQGLTQHFAFFPSLTTETDLLRFALIFRKQSDRDNCLSALTGAKLGASGSYPCPLDGFEASRRYLASPGDLPNALDLSRKVLTLPLHPYVSESDVAQIGLILKNILK